jgi:hypothetical protein
MAQDAQDETEDAWMIIGDIGGIGIDADGVGVSVEGPEDPWVS